MILKGLKKIDIDLPLTERKEIELVPKTTKAEAINNLLRWLREDFADEKLKHRSNPLSLKRDLLHMLMNKEYADSKV